MVCCTPVCQKWTAYGFSGGFILSGFLLIFCWKNLFNSILHKQLTLTEGSIQYKNWLDMPVDIFMEFYLFNWTNSEEFTNGGEWTKPRFEEVGPYVFSVHNTRINVKFYDNNTMSYNTIRTYKFVPERTNGTQEDHITIMNPIVMSIAGLLKEKHPLVRRGVHYFLKRTKTTMALATTVKEITFDGVSSQVLDVGRRLKFVEGYEVPFDKFGYFYGRNGSWQSEGDFTIWTGEGNIRKTGVMDEWNHRTVSKGYEGECSKINGSSGEVFYPVENDETFSLFQADFCGKVTLERQGSYTKNGIEGNRYISTDKMLDNGNIYPSTACYSPGEYLASGVRNMEACQYHAPAFLSLPHFYLADESFRSEIEGMNPDPSKHKMYFIIEPNLGLPIDIHITFQANMKLFNVQYIDIVDNVNDTMIPLMWARISSGVPDSDVSLVKLAIAAPAIGMYLGYCFVALGLILFIYGVFLELRIRKGFLTYFDYLRSTFSFKVNSSTASDSILVDKSL